MWQQAKKLIWGPSSKSSSNSQSVELSSITSTPSTELKSVVAPRSGAPTDAVVSRTTLLQHHDATTEPIMQQQQLSSAGSPSNQQHPVQSAASAEEEAAVERQQASQQTLATAADELTQSDWLIQCSSGVRLLLSICQELGLLQLADASSCQAGCAQLRQLLPDVLRALVQHYCPQASAAAAAAAAAKGEWAQLASSTTADNDSLSAQFLHAAAAAGTACEEAGQMQPSSSSTSSDMQDSLQQQLEACIVLGEAVRLQQHQHVWERLQQLVPPPSASGVQDTSQPAAGQHSLRHASQVVPVLQAWASVVAGAADNTDAGQQQQQVSGSSDQQLPLQWDKLLTSLQHLQQQVQAAVSNERSQQLKQADQLQGDQPLLEALQQLCGSGVLPVLLQPADLDARQPHLGYGSMALVVLMRLAAATADLWRPLLPASHSSDAAGGSAASTWRKPTAFTRSPRNSWPDELLNTSQLWPGDVANEDDAAAISREERTLRCWINSVLHRNAAAAAAGGAACQQQLAQSFSVDSGLLSSAQDEQPLLLGGQGAGPLRSQSCGGSYKGSAAAATGQQQEQAVPRSSSPGAAAAAAVAASADLGSSSTTGTISLPAPADNRSISADITEHAAADSPRLTSTSAAEPDAPSTPTAAAASAAPLFSQASVGAGGLPAKGAAAAAARVPTISSVTSLFGAELRSGLLLLEILELLQPGCVDWRLANRPPFVSRTAQLKALENCQLALKIAQEDLGLPLVSMSPRDIVLGRRKIILSLVYQLMRYNTMQMLESISAVQQQEHTTQLATASGRNSATGGSEPSTPTAAADTEAAGKALGSQQLPPSGTRHTGGRLNIRSSSRKQRGQLAVTEQDILVWANSKLQQVQPLAAARGNNGASTPVIRSFKDPALGSGVVLLQLLHVLDPTLVDLSFVSPGATPQQRQSNARYALSLADKMGCSLFLVWEDLVDPPQPRMVLVLLASLMYQDLQRQQRQQQQQQQHDATTPPLPAAAAPAAAGQA